MNGGDFPRGGGISQKRPHEGASVEVKARESSKDFLFDTTSSAKRHKSLSEKKNKSVTTPSSTIGSLGQLGGGGVIRRRGAVGNSGGNLVIEAISFSKLHPGVKLLGIVRQVTEDYAIVSLPNMLTGYVRRKTEGKTPLNHMLYQHQILATSVIKTATETLAGGVSKRRVELSIQPRDINSGMLDSETMLSNGVKIRCEIRTLEDHGAVVDVGLPGVLAFLPFEKVEGYNGCFRRTKRSDDGSSDSDESLSDETDEESDSSDLDVDSSKQRKLQTGMMFDGIIVSISEQGGRPLLTLSLPLPKAFANMTEDEILSDKVKYTLKALVPGMKVNCFVDSYAQNGMLVNFLTHFRGAIDHNHLGGLYAGDDWKRIFKDGCVRGVTARIIAIDAASKLIRLTLLPHLLKMELPKPFPSFAKNGTILNDQCHVLRIDKGVGVLIGISPEDDSFDEKDEIKRKREQKDVFKSGPYLKALETRGIFVHISKCVDEPKRKKHEEVSKTDLSKIFKVDKCVPKVRILTTNHCLFEGWATGTTAQSAVADGAVLDYSDVVPGSIHRGVEILRVLDSGVLVSLGNGIKAICSNMHLSDTNFSKKASLIKQKLSVGKKLDSVRVIVSDPLEKRCSVTMKPTLLRDKSEPLTSFESCKRGRRCTGFISKVTEKGVNVAFYNDVHGFISSKSLARDAGVENPLENYHVGNTLVCRVVAIEKRDSRYRLSLSLDNGEDEIVGSTLDTDLTSITAGTILKNGKVVKLSLGEDDGIENFEPGYAIVHFSKPVKIECRLNFDQLSDTYDTKCSNSVLNGIGTSTLKVGKRLKTDAILMNDIVDGTLPSISLKASLISCRTSSTESPSIILPSIANELFVGAICIGYVVRIDKRFGAFVRFLNGLTGIIPKLKKGCDMPLFDTITCKVIALDLSDADRPKILLQQSSKKKKRSISNINDEASRAMRELKVGDIIDEVEVENINFHRANVLLSEGKYRGGKGRVRIHFTMASPITTKVSKEKKTRKINDKDNSTSSPSSEQDDARLSIPEHHPFFGWSKGDKIHDLHVVGIEIKDDMPFIDLSNVRDAMCLSSKEIKPGKILSGIITSHAKNNSGLWINISPGLQGWICGLELCKDAAKLNNMTTFYPIGSRVDAVVLGVKKETIELSVIQSESTGQAEKLSKTKLSKPKRGDIVVGRIQRPKSDENGPALNLELRGHKVARCCFTELCEMDDWENMPLGKMNIMQSENNNEDIVETSVRDDTDYAHGSYVTCRVLGTTRNSCVNVSLRESRLEGDLELDPVPDEGDIVQGYVIRTDRKGCFVRLSYSLTGRIILKELADEFVPNPSAVFPQGRLITAKVKTVTKSEGKITVDLDMRESSLIADGTLIKLEDLEEGSKAKGTVSRVERYGVFVKLDNSDVSGLSHLSECSDKYVENLENMYDPGDRVKVLILKVDHELKRVSLGLKASYFEDDIDSSDSSEDESSIGDDDSSVASSSSENESISEPSIQSDDEGFVTKVALKEKSSNVSDTDSVSSKANGESSGSSSDDDSGNINRQALDLEGVGFDWEGESTGNKRKLSNASDTPTDDSDYSEDESGDDSDDEKVTKHSSRKKAVKRKREEAEVARREAQLADGTADENPVTTADFERLLAGDPNSSEVYIRFMAHHLSLSDIDSARAIAERGFERIEFREEGEKLNVWSALLVLEMKYGSEKSFRETIDRASNQNNPKQVYLRVCEMLEKEVDAFDSISEKSKGYEETVIRADNMYSKMCKKFRNKKTVWIAHMRYLLKCNRHAAAHDILKRSILSLPEYKHIATVSKLAQLEFEFGSAERARTLFDGLIEKYPKRLDLVFVFIDMEVKHGSGVKAARKIFMRIITSAGSVKNSKKYSDKQMKSLFKKWFKIEEDFGDEDSQEKVKAEARAYVERST